ncbi:PAS domain S-box protein [Roseococcus sp. SDR]|uniref:PAS domain S-box protein n=1 Tax=Roseococcus sp. SDR TaxID=2835532 RepID=UPI001BCD743B|nr:PAS domain S-box protein [Roseococcus sp. SDR]MBS7789734.1 PAS domain S-box protein [Roseococcus sp. SDR]MBV1845048.1 PAS domain S-box protein [Roseococcus sp. SDR]
MPDATRSDAWEKARLAALQRYGVLDTAPEPAFDRIVRLAAHALAAPVALISLVDAARVWFKAANGFAEHEMPRVSSLSGLALAQADITVVPDTRLDPRCAANPLVLGAPHVRFYAGAPLITPDGYPIGVLCIVDTAPRAGLSASEALAMRDLAAMVMDLLELRLETAERERLASRARLRERMLASNAEAPTSQHAIDAAMEVVREVTGSMLCLLFRTAPDGRRLQILGGRTDQPVGDAQYIESLRAMDFNLDNTLSGMVIRGEAQAFFHQFTPELLASYPGLKLSAERGARAQLITPVSLDDDRYSMVLSFREVPADIEPVKALMREVGSTMRPLLRRLREAESAQLLHRAVHASADAVIISDTAALPDEAPRIRYVNPAFTEQTGYAAEDVIGQPPRFLDGPGSSDPAREAIRAALRQRLPVRQQVESFRRDGTKFWADLQIAPVADATGWLTHWVAIQRDVTAQKIEALALAEREAYFRHFFEQHPAPMWVYDRETLHFVEVNAAAIRTYGMSREEFRRKTILDVRPPEDREAALAMVEMLSPEYTDSGPWRHITATGAVRLVQTRGQAIQLRGRVAHLVVIWDVTERIEAERAAQELASELNATLESISDGFFTVDAQWRFRYVNAWAEEMLGRPATELVGRGIDEGETGRAQAALIQRLRQVHAGGVSERFLHRDTRRQRWLDVTGYPTPTGGLTVYLRDVTAQRSSEDRLRLLEAVVDKLNDVILITEAEPIEQPGPRIVYVNAAFERLTGYAPEEVLGKTPRILQAPTTSRAELDRIHAALARWSPVRAELLNRTKAGEEFWVELDIVPVADEAGWYTHWVAVERDVTERKRAQIKLEEQAALLDQSRDAIMVHNMDGRISYWNRSAERIYGWAAVEAQGRSVVSLLGADPATFREAWDALLRDGHWTGRMRQRRKNGEVMIVEAHKTLLREPDGTPRAVLAVDSDVTERVKLEEQLRQAQRMEAVGQLTGGIAHDFNNLLTVVLGNAEILLERLDGDPALSPVAAVTLAAAERGADLTSRLLAFSRQQMLNPRVTDVDELLVALKELIRRAIDERVEIVVTRMPGLWPALVDGPQLETAILNLCLNARDAMPFGGRMAITTTNFTAVPAGATGELAAGDYVLIEVSDTGTGMSPEVAARAFEPFFTTKEVGKGSGLGLSMVYGFAKQSGGHASIASTPGLGTTIRLYIPRAREAAAAPPRPGHAAFRGGSERILLVEDDPLVREHSARQLRGLGYDVAVAANGAEGLRLLTGAARFDLLFTDIVMPGEMTGLELAAEAQRIRCGLRVLFSSGYTEQSGAHETRLRPGMLLLPKPYRLRELAEKVRQALEAEG